MILAISVIVSSFSLIASMSRMSKMGVIFRGDGVGGWLAVWFSLSWQRLMFELEFEHNVIPWTFRIRNANEMKYRKWLFIVWVVETLLNQFKLCFMWGHKSNGRIRTYFIDLDFYIAIKVFIRVTKFIVVTIYQVPLLIIDRNHIEAVHKKKKHIPAQLGIFPCPYPNCHWKFNKEENLISHLQSLHGNKNTNANVGGGGGFDETDTSLDEDGAPIMFPNQQQGTVKSVLPIVAKSRSIWQHWPYMSDLWKWMEFFYFCRCCFERWPCQTYHHDVSMCWLYVLELSHWWIAGTSCSSASRNGMRIWNARHVFGSIIIKPHTLLYYHQRRSQGACNSQPSIP